MVILTKDLRSPLNFKEGVIIPVNKPKTWTSFDVVNKIRYNLKPFYGKTKVGHAGTLDPLATGLLLIAVGKATKQINNFMGMDKCYEADVVLGATTPSYDAESEIDATFPIDHITQELVEEKLKDFTGEIEQMPPVFSAIKVDGKTAYQLARKGKEVTLQPRTVTINQIELLKFEKAQIKLTVDCSKGTYIRSLAFDLGKALNSGGYLGNLIRTSIGEHALKDAWELDELIQFIEPENCLVENI